MNSVKRPESLWGEVWQLAWPTVITMTSYTVMQFVDAILLGQVGTEDVAAQGNAGVWAFAPISIAAGTLSLVNTFVSQHLGAGDANRGAKFAWAGLWLSLAWWILVMLPLAAALPWFFEHIHGGLNQPSLVQKEVSYGKILLVGGIFSLLGRLSHNCFFGLHRPKVVTLSALVGNLTNLMASYALIFGEVGVPALGIPGVPSAPQLGVAGAAWGTVVGSIVEAIIPIAALFMAKTKSHFDLVAARGSHPSACLELFHRGWPASISWGSELVCWAWFMTALVGRFGPDHMTASWIAMRYMHLSFMPAVGFSVAITSIVGRLIGEGSPEEAQSRVRVTLKIGIVYMSLWGLIFATMYEPLIGIFINENTPEATRLEITRLGRWMLLCAALWQTLDAVGIVLSGALRGAGDTTWPGLVMVGLQWSILMGCGYLSLWLIPQSASLGPWIAATLYILVLGVAMAWRWKSGRWRNIKLVDPSDASVG
ncbi:MAG: MATE family efflux transporter [Planctomycetota bacterium]|nr:MATE family efflux transporter [Planctomycetota bacterium]